MAIGGIRWVGMAGSEGENMQLFMMVTSKPMAVGSYAQAQRLSPSLIPPGPPSMLGFHPPTCLSGCWFMQRLPMWIGGLGLCSFSYCLACVHACPLYRSASISSIASSSDARPCLPVEQEANQAEQTINWYGGVSTFLIICLGLSGPDVALSLG